MSARAFLTARPNSFAFEDRLLVLDAPVKVKKDGEMQRLNVLYFLELLFDFSEIFDPLYPSSICISFFHEACTSQMFLFDIHANM